MKAERRTFVTVIVTVKNKIYQITPAVDRNPVLPNLVSIQQKQHAAVSDR